MTAVSLEAARAICRAFIDDTDCFHPEACEAETWFLDVFDMTTSAPLTEDYTATTATRLGELGFSADEIAEVLAWYAGEGCPVPSSTWSAS